MTNLSYSMLSLWPGQFESHGTPALGASWGRRCGLPFLTSLPEGLDQRAQARYHDSPVRAESRFVIQRQPSHASFTFPPVAPLSPIMA